MAAGATAGNGSRVVGNKPIVFAALLLGMAMLATPAGAGGQPDASVRPTPPLPVPAAQASQRPAYARAATQPTAARAPRYFVEFRARTGFYGHTYVVYGELNGRGERVGMRYAGLYPEGGPVGFMLGHVLPVPATVEPVEDDKTDPVTERYVRILSAEEFAKLAAAIDRVRANTRLWNALLNNCNDFAAELAQEIGLRAPSTLLIPDLFVSELREMNGS